MVLKPLGTRIIVKRKKIGKVGSLYVPRDSREMKVCIGEIIDVGPGCDFLKAGDIVTFGKYAPINIDVDEIEHYGLEKPKTDDAELLLMNEEDALCIIATGE